jgi:hypothetical protein
VHKNICYWPFLLVLIGFIITSCTQPAQEMATLADTIVPSSTVTQTFTHTPSPTITVEPTSTLKPTQTNTPEPPQEVNIQEIPLAGFIASPKAQISGMAWHGDTLVILPQFPEKVPGQSGNASLFTLLKKDILAYLEGTSPGPLTPTTISFNASTIGSQIPGYEGYEAIIFNGDQVHLTIEANDNGTMAGYLIDGIYLPGLESIQIDPSSLSELPVPVQIFNYSYESLINAEDKSMTIYEANGVDLNPNPFVYLIEKSSNIIEELGFRNIEYRITDATGMDENGRFWVANIFMPVEFWLYTISDSIFDDYGKGETHSKHVNVERLLELQYNGDVVSLTDTEPVQLKLDDESNARNWEALVVLDDLGFLAMTDTFPDTILAFIPFPDN